MRKTVMKVVGDLDDETPARLEAAKAHVRAYENAMRAAWGAGQIVNNAFRDWLQQRGAGNEARALQGLVNLRRIDVPPSAQRIWRDVEIRHMATGLFAAELPYQRSIHAVAKILAIAGRDLEQGRSLTDRPPFDGLTPDERQDLQASIRYVLAAPGVRWPRLRALEDILGICRNTP